MVKKGYGVQVIYGPKVSVIKSNLEDYLEGYDEKAVIAVSILSPVTGEVFELSSVPDEAFSSGMMGDGIAVLPTDPEITAPVAGTIAFVFDTKACHRAGNGTGNRCDDPYWNRYGKAKWQRL